MDQAVTVNASSNSIWILIGIFICIWLFIEWICRHGDWTDRLKWWLGIILIPIGIIIAILVFISWPHQAWSYIKGMLGSMVIMYIYSVVKSDLRAIIKESIKEAIKKL